MKISPRTTPAQATAALAVGLIAMPAVMAASHPVPSHPTPSHPASASAARASRASRAPALTISIGDGRPAVRAGDELTYTVTVVNSGAMSVPRVKVTQTLSAGLAFVSASDQGVAADGHVNWWARLPVGAKRVYHVTARVTRTPATLLRLAALACATLPGAKGPIVCAAHLDRLPAATAATATSRSAHSAGGVLPYTVGGVAALALGLLAVVARRRSRLRRQPA